jgi:hypothetical protein
MDSAPADTIYYTCQWNDRPITVVSLEYDGSGLFGTYTMTFSDGSKLKVSGELGGHGGVDRCDPVVFFKWNELFPSYTQTAHDSASERIDDVATEHAQCSSFV